MACHDVGWVLGVRMCFGSLDFIITIEGDLERAPILAQLLPVADLNVIFETLEGLRLHPPESRAPQRRLPFDPSLGGPRPQFTAWEPPFPRNFP
jgi:hypothetical protein